MIDDYAPRGPHYHAEHGLPPSVVISLAPGTLLTPDLIVAIGSRESFPAAQAIANEATPIYDEVVAARARRAAWVT